MEESSDIEGTSYFALFTKIDDAKIERLNLDNYQVNVPETGKVVVSGFAGIIENSEVENISLRDFSVKVKKSESITVGIIAGISDDDTKLKNIYINGEIDDLNEGIVKYFDKGEAHNIISDIKYHGTILSNNVDELYIIRDDLIYRGEEEIDPNSLIELLSDGLPSDYYWSFDKNIFKILTHKLDVIEVPEESQKFNFSIQNSSAISLHAKGVEGTSVYVND